MIRLLPIAVLSFLMLLFSCENKNYIGVETMLKVETRKVLTEEDITKVKRELKERLEGSGFDVFDINSTSSENEIHLTVLSNIDSLDQNYYNSLFEPTRIGFYTINKLSDKITRDLDYDKIHPDFPVTYSYLEKGYYPDGVLMNTTAGSMLESIKESLQDSLKHINTLKLAWYHKRWDGDRLSFLLYMLNDDKEFSFTASEETLIGTKVDMNSANGKLGVRCFFNEKGTALLQKILNKAMNEKRQFAILFNDKIIASIRVPTPVKIDNSFLVTHDFTLEEATFLVKNIKLKALSYDLKILEQSIKNRFQDEK